MLKKTLSLILFSTAVSAIPTVSGQPQVETPAPRLTVLLCHKDKNSREASIVLPDRFTVSFSEVPAIVQIGAKQFPRGQFSVTGTAIEIRAVHSASTRVFWIQIRRSDGAYRVIIEGTTIVEDTGKCELAPRSF